MEICVKKNSDFHIFSFSGFKSRF